MHYTISAVIPTLNPGNRIIALLNCLINQTVAINEIIVVDSESNDGSPELIKEIISNQSQKSIRLITINRKDFNHGGTRDMALRLASGDFVLFFTQDALPQSGNYVEQIMRPFDDPKIAMASGRQIARPGARPFERLVREYNYPDYSYTRDYSDIQRMGIKAFFASDVCAAYRRTSYLSVGGFENPVSTNEDMFIAASFLHAGYKIAYVAEACVIHSHNFTFKQQYKRNYSMGKEIQLHKDLLGDAKLTGEGFGLVKYVLRNLLKRGLFFEAICFCFDCVARLTGNKFGSAAAKKHCVKTAN